MILLLNRGQPRSPTSSLWYQPPAWDAILMYCCCCCKPSIRCMLQCHAKKPSKQGSYLCPAGGGPGTADGDLSEGLPSPAGVREARLAAATSRTSPPAAAAARRAQPQPLREFSHPEAHLQSSQGRDRRSVFTSSPKHACCQGDPRSGTKLSAEEVICELNVESV